ncbi:MAG: hypothetical protein OXC91_06585 [Rhodobacteraceae bacterium]|nr:hypothetical protein [Paracoccaceae bacterium]
MALPEEGVCPVWMALSGRKATPDQRALPVGQMALPVIPVRKAREVNRAFPVNVAGRVFPAPWVIPARKVPPVRKVIPVPQVIPVRKAGKGQWVEKVCPEMPAPLELTASRVAPVLMVAPAQRDRPVILARKVLRVEKVFPAIPVIPVLPARMEPPEQMEPPEPMEPPAIREPLAGKARLETRGRMEPPAQTALPVHKEILESKAEKDLLEMRVTPELPVGRPEIQVRKANRESLARKVRWVFLVLPAQPDLPAEGVCPARTALPVPLAGLPDRKVNPAPRERLVRMAQTALPEGGVCPVWMELPAQPVPRERRATPALMAIPALLERKATRDHRGRRVNRDRLVWWDQQASGVKRVFPASKATRELTQPSKVHKARSISRYSLMWRTEPPRPPQRAEPTMWEPTR